VTHKTRERSLPTEEILTAVTPGDEDFSAEARHADSDTPAPVVRVRFWGVRGSLPTPGPETIFYGGNTSCVEVRANDEIIILDAGSGIRRLGLALCAEFKNRPMHLNLLITHTHWDHIQGFPFFLPAYNPENKLRILGVEGARSDLEKTLSSQMESPYFPISMPELPGNITIEELKNMRATAGSVEIKAMFLHHPGICVGYRLATSGGSIAYVTDHEPFERFMKITGKNSPEDVAYARGKDEQLAAFIDGADILIIDSQYDATEYKDRAGWGHGCVDDVVAIATKARAKRLFLFHHDPDHDDGFISKMVAHSRDLVHKARGTLLVEAARERSEVIIP
jgi:phosphoribosyl 1,2-cyclic phosphodiesterase